MKVLIFLSAIVVAAVAQYGVDPMAAPIPYSFSYASPTEDGGSSGHQESGDGAGRVTGSYTVQDLEGHTRVVEYIADEGGFRATVRTNEPGTANMNPADVIMESTAPESAAAPMYTLGAGAPQPQAAPAVAGNRGGVRYVLVPSTDPRARGYY